jgi:hypothetical protein
VAAVVLTLGRWWSRGQLGGEVYEGGVDVHAGGRSPRLLLLAPSWFTSFSPPARRGASRACRRRPGGEVVPAPVRLSAPPLSGATRRQRARFFPQSGADGAVVEEETPRGGWMAWRPCHTAPLLLNRRREQLEEEKPSMPLAVRRAGQVALEAAAWGRLGCSVEGQMGL